MSEERNIINDRFSGWKLFLYQLVFPMRGYERSQHRPWMLLCIWDGSWAVDGEHPEFQEHLHETIRQLAMYEQEGQG